jgi:hypothetical protein
MVLVSSYSMVVAWTCCVAHELPSCPMGSTYPASVQRSSLGTESVGMRDMVSEGVTSDVSTGAIPISQCFFGRRISSFRGVMFQCSVSSIYFTYTYHWAINHTVGGNGNLLTLSEGDRGRPLLGASIGQGQPGISGFRLESSIIELTGALWSFCLPGHSCELSLQ